MTFEAALSECLNAAPYITGSLAAIGLATVAFIVWVILKPILSYIVSGPRQMMSFWLYSVFIFGGASWGYSQKDMQGMWQGLGMTCVIASAATVLCYWLRQWVAWNYGENKG